jgi:hypothetical protein
MPRPKRSKSTQAGKPLLSSSERSERVRKAWLTRRANKKRAERLQRKLLNAELGKGEGDTILSEKEAIRNRLNQALEKATRARRPLHRPGTTKTNGASTSMAENSAQPTDLSNAGFADPGRTNAGAFTGNISTPDALSRTISMHRNAQLCAFLGDLVSIRGKGGWRDFLPIMVSKPQIEAIEDFLLRSGYTIFNPPKLPPDLKD